MSGRPLVSTITGTWNRPGLVMEMLENIRAQSYRPLEAVIVADGPDPELRAMIEAEQGKGDVPIVFAELGFHSSSVLTDSISAGPFMTAQLLAHGDYQLWVSDDERMFSPDHIALLVDLIEAQGVDFAYPLVEIWFPNRPHRQVIGTDPPRQGTITHCAYRRSALDKGMLFRTHVGSGTDWDAVERTMASAGGQKNWAFLRQVTFGHQADK